MGNKSSPQVKPIDLILLLVLAALIYAIIDTGSHPSHRGAPIKASMLQIKACETAFELFKDDNGRYPGGTNGLNDLVAQPAGATNWHQYLSKVPLDPWGHPYLYVYPGKHNTNSFDLSSAGADGIPGTVDDIGNWK